MDKKTLIIAHRGESWDAPENTLASINLAWQRGAKAVECDVHLSKDKKIMVIHDDNTRRTTGFNKPVEEQISVELQKLDAGLWHAYQGDGAIIPTLEQVLDTIPQQCKLLVEVKCDIEIVPILHDLLTSHQVEPEQIILMDFNYATVSKMKSLMPGYEVLWLSTMRRMKYIPINIDVLITKTLSAGLNGLNILNQPRINQKLVDKVKNAGLKLYVWTVDDPNEMKRLIDLGVDGIATNRARWMKDNLQIEHACLPVYMP